jgi:hypothetical protein
MPSPPPSTRISRAGQGGEARMHQRLVVAVFVARGKLQVVVEVEPGFVAPAGDDDALVGAGFGVDDVLVVEVGLGQADEVAGETEGDGECADHRDALRAQCRQRAELGAEQPQRPGGNQRVEQAEQQRAPDQPEVRRQQQREQQRHGQRADVVDAEHLRHEVLEGHFALEDAHDQRNLQPDQYPDQQHQAVEREAEGSGVQREQQEQQSGGKAAEQTHQQFDLDEAHQQVADDVLRQPGADAHGKQVGADHGGELRHRIAQQVARQRAGDQLVGQPAGGDDENGDEQWGLHVSRAGWPARRRQRRAADADFRGSGFVRDGCFPGSQRLGAQQGFELAVEFGDA